MPEFVCPHCHAVFRERQSKCPNDGSILIEVPVINDLSEQVLNKKYRLEKQLGQGGFGSVYSATHLVLGKQVAVKVLRTEFRSDSTMVARFFNEARVVTRLANPHTIATFDLDQTEDGLLFMVMDFVTGRTLRQLAKQEGTPPGRLPWKRSLQLLVQVCDSLEEAHSAGVIHRDLKPDNVMVSNRGGETDFVTVLDFGIAKVFEGAEMQQLTAQGSLIGSPAYMSPEQILGRDLDPKSDIYSLGCVTYQLLSGTLPVNARQTAAMLQEKVLTKPDTIRKKAPDTNLPVELEHLVMQMLELEPSNRPASAAEVKRAFLGFLGTSTAEAIPAVSAISWGVVGPSNKGTRAYGAEPEPVIPQATDRTQSLDEDPTAYLETMAQPTPDDPHPAPPQSQPLTLDETMSSSATGMMTGETMEANYASVEPEKRGGIPKWVWIALPVLLIAMAASAYGLFGGSGEDSAKEKPKTDQVETVAVGDGTVKAVEGEKIKEVKTAADSNTKPKTEAASKGKESSSKLPEKKAMAIEVTAKKKIEPKTEEPPKTPKATEDAEAIVKSSAGDVAEDVAEEAKLAAVDVEEDIKTEDAGQGAVVAAGVDQAGPKEEKDPDGGSTPRVGAGVGVTAGAVGGPPVAGGGPSAAGPGATDGGQAEVAKKAQEEAAAKAKAEARKKAEAEARKKAEAEAKARAEADAKAKAEADAKAKAEADAKAKAEADAKAKAEAEAKARAETDAKAKAEADAKAKAAADAKAKAAANAKAKAEADAKARAKAEAEAKAKAEAEAKRKEAEAKRELENQMKNMDPAGDSDPASGHANEMFNELDDEDF